MFRKFRHQLFRRKLKKMNNIIPDSCVIGKDVELLDSELGEECRIAHHASIRSSRVGRLTSIGRYSKLTHSHVGSFCAISWDVTINALTHPDNHLAMSAFPYVPYVGQFVETRTQHYKLVKIANDVWIGAHAVVMPGIEIGNGAVIGAGAVVTKNVPDYAIVAGVPAKVLRFRFSEQMISRLLMAKWWDLDKSIIKANIDLFQHEFTEESIMRLEDICRI